MHAIKRSTTLVYLNFSSCEMTALAAARVIRSLRQNESVLHLVLSNSEGQLKNAIGYKFLENLPLLLQTNIFIQFLDLSNNRLCDHGFKLISRAFRNNATLSNLYLENCEITYRAEGEILGLFSSMKMLQDLNISRNKINCRGAIALASALLSNHSSNIWKLNIASCGIKTEGTRRIFSDLKTNKSLTIIVLDYNEIDDETLSKIFVDALRMNTKLLDLSLKSCGINDDNIELVLKALSKDTHMHTLSLAENELTTKSMYIFYQWFYLDRSVK